VRRPRSRLPAAAARYVPAVRLGTLPITRAAQRALTFAVADELTPAGIHFATVTINGTIGADVGFTRDRIDETFWTMHAAVR
jgi:hypothetical protein